MYAPRPEPQKTTAEKEMARAVAKRRQAMQKRKAQGVEILTPHEESLRWLAERRQIEELNQWLKNGKC